MRELLATFITPHLFLGLCVACVDTKAPIWISRECCLSVVSGTECRAPPSSFPPNMCPLRPCSLPTTTGVFVRDTAEWLAYSPAVTAKILQSYGLSVSDLTATGDAVKEDRPGSPRSVLGGAPSASASPDRGTLDLGSFGLGGGAYTLDTGRGLQLSPRGFSRQILFVFADIASRDRFARTLSACDMKCETAVAQGVTTRSTGKVITRILLAPVHVVSRVLRLPIRLFCIGGGGGKASEKTNASAADWQLLEETQAERVAYHFQLAAKRKKTVHEEAAELAARREKEEAAARRKKAAAKRDEEAAKRTKAAAKRTKAAAKRKEKAAKRKEEAKRKLEAGDKVLRDVKKILKANRKAIDAVTKDYPCAELVNEPKLDPKQLPHVARFVELVASKSTEIVLGYHGTSAENAAAIMAGGFCPMKRRSPDGAYFSGNHRTSFDYAARNGSGGSILLVALVRESYLGTINASESRKDPLNRRVDGDLVDHDIVIFEEYACLPLAHIRGVC